MMSRSVLVAVALLSSVLGLLTPNPLLTGAAVASFWVILYVTWRPGEVPALTLACFMHWVASAAKVLKADVLGVDIRSASLYPHPDEATALSLLAVVAFAVSVRVGFGWQPKTLPPPPVASHGLERRMLTAWVAMLIVGATLEIPQAAGMTQLARAIVTLKWVPVLLVFTTVLRLRREYWALWLVFGVEVLLGTLTYFSSFKVPLFMLAVAFVVTGRAREMTARQWLGAASLGAVAVIAGIMWTAVKVEYRSYLDGNTGQQRIRQELSAGDMVGRLGTLVSNIDERRFSNAAINLVDRISYVDYFGAAIAFVPAVQPHGGGARMTEALQHVLMPRILFPGKAALDDTADTARYTGLDFRDVGSGTSIALGYPAEAYIDGGTTYMAFPVMCFGLLLGLLARHFATRTSDPLIGNLLAVTLFMNVTTIELSFKKMLGGYVIAAMASEIARRVVLPRVVPWLWGTQRRPPQYPAAAAPSR